MGVPLPGTPGGEKGRKYMFTEDSGKLETNLVLPVLAMRGLVFFPGMMLQFEVARKKSVLAVS